jgi:hypothetical protein
VTIRKLDDPAVTEPPWDGAAVTVIRTGILEASIEISAAIDDKFHGCLCRHHPQNKW